jgi:hypothetical protein
MRPKKIDLTGLSPAELDEYASADSHGGAEYGGGAIYDTEPLTIGEVVSSLHRLGDLPGLGDELWGPQADRAFR